MCIVKTPKVAASSEKPKEPTIIRSPYLDGVDPATKAMRKGRSSLRIERADGRAPAPVAPTAPVTAPPAHVAPVAPLTPPVRGGGWVGGRIERIPVNSRR